MTRDEVALRMFCAMVGNPNWLPVNPGNEIISAYKLADLFIATGKEGDKHIGITVHGSKT